LVSGPNPLVATKVALLPHDIEELPLRQLLELLLGEDGKRKLRRRQMTNEQLFASYDSELVLKNRSPKGLYEARRVLKHFHEYLGEFPPTTELGKKFLAQFALRKIATLYRYTQVLTAFFNWYGEKLDVKIKMPHTLPEYVEDVEINKFVDAIENRSSHKKLAKRDVLLVRLALNTGLRRAELANLKIKDIHLEQQILVVRNGKGGKDATEPLNSTITALLRSFITPDMGPEQLLFGLKPGSISSKFAWFAKKAKVNIHAHTLRHVYGTRLIERGANPEAVRQLMRHTRFDTTQKYISLAPKGLKEAVSLLDLQPGGLELPASSKSIDIRARQAEMPDEKPVSQGIASDERTDKDNDGSKRNNLKNPLHVEKVVPLLSGGWGLKICNITDVTAQNCTGTLELIEKVNPEMSNPYCWSDLLASRRFKWDDTETIPASASAILSIINIEYPLGLAGIEANCYSLAYKETEASSYVLPKDPLLLMISLVADGFSPIFALCLFFHTDLSQGNNLRLIAANLNERPSLEECRRMFLRNSVETEFDFKG
jgi:integrase/recombinase XerD